MAGSGQGCLHDCRAGPEPSSLTARTLPPQAEKREAEAKRGRDAVKAEQRACELLQRRLERAELDVEKAAEELPGLRVAVQNCKASVASAQRTQRREAAAAQEAQQELERALGAVAGEKQLVRGLLRAA